MTLLVTIVHVISWIIFLGLIPLTLAALWIKNRSSVQCWVRLHRQAPRWLLVTEIPADSTQDDQDRALQTVVEQARNFEWDAACAYRRRNRQSGTWLIGLISNKEPGITEGRDAFIQIPAATVLRASGSPRDEGVTVLEKVQAWSRSKAIDLKPEVYSLRAQSFQCWEWPLASEVEPPGLAARIVEKVFELRDIAFYPLIVTPLTIAMLGTGNSWLFGIGIFTVILLSGAHKFVFLHQREDATQERHLQNY
ncbi:hypothetical protein JO972_15710 [Verrucomicrobiaceae bacterium 5K15]|uniref:Uncharacterized protein n=1 Tax=Oceaniferula flava TaxID=2800421 RepID=A0AAE2SFH9_9BACT|nr:hypothetical protein [Oceaniferula flavus]MBK1856417.1 hypothetical protein [Oceaniferula flavus]MBM1137724.1 hypothetical protein [Oceaniferula flavus]